VNVVIRSMLKEQCQERRKETRKDGCSCAGSPFAMTTQPSGQHWTAATVNNVTLGTMMMAVSLLGILGYMLFALRELIRETQAKQEMAEEQAS
jgi:hypothetical protein